MKKRAHNSILISFSVAILAVTLLPFYAVGFCQTDTTPPQLTILNTFRYTPNPEVILHGYCYDESGIKNVTVNGELATGAHHNNWFDWQKTVNLTEGVNNIEVLVYDNSPNNMVSEKTIEVTYQPLTYSGPTIDLLIPTEITADSVTLNCILNPHTSRIPASDEYVKVFVHYTFTDLESNSFLYGEYLGNQYYGRADIPLTFQIESDTQEV